jgi:hypothetical protein
MLAEHFDNGDGSPPITAFTANDSYANRSRAVKKIVQEPTSGLQHPGSHFPLQILQYINSWLGASFCLQVASCRSLNREAIPSNSKISAEIQTGLSGEAL